MFCINTMIVIDTSPDITGNIGIECICGTQGRKLRLKHTNQQSSVEVKIVVKSIKSRLNQP